MRSIYKVGDRVEILQVLAPIRHRFTAGKVYGRITHIDGEYHLVRPLWCKWETECYRNEIKSDENSKQNRRYT